MAPPTLFILALILSSAASFAAAATCTVNTQNSILTADISTAADNVANNNLNPPAANPLYLPASSSWETTYGSALLCLKNNYLYENTHVALADIASGASDVVSQCCTVGTICQGGDYTVTGDSGLTTILSVLPGGVTCTAFS